MRIIAKRTLKEYWTAHANCRKELEEWYALAIKANWSSPRDVKNVFPKASVVGNNRVVFNIVGNNYRLIVKFAYKSRIGFIRFIGTHSEYDKVDAESI